MLAEHVPILADSLGGDRDDASITADLCFVQYHTRNFRRSFNVAKRRIESRVRAALAESTHRQPRIEL